MRLAAKMLKSHPPLDARGLGGFPDRATGDRTRGETGMPMSRLGLLTAILAALMLWVGSAVRVAAHPQRIWSHAHQSLGYPPGSRNRVSGVDEGLALRR